MCGADTFQRPSKISMSLLDYHMEADKNSRAINRALSFVSQVIPVHMCEVIVQFMALGFKN